jgi:hypothetical protein
MVRELIVKNWKTGEVATRIDVTGKSERHIERVEMGLIMKCDLDAGWNVYDSAVDVDA